MYKIVIHNKIVKRLETVSKSHLRSLSALLEALETNPVPWRDFDLKKIVGAENTYRVRIGDYRVVYFIEKERETIHILKFELNLGERFTRDEKGGNVLWEINKSV